jgi:hypothetical protein
MARQGEKPVTNTAFQAQLAKLKNQINSALSFLVFNNTSGEKKDFIIQFDIQSINAAGTAVSFLHSFKAGTVPGVFGTSQNKLAAFSCDGAPTAAGFTGVSSKISDGSGLTSVCMWFAIGER